MENQKEVKNAEVTNSDRAGQPLLCDVKKPLIIIPEDQYRIGMYFRLQIGLNIQVDFRFKVIAFDLPFIMITFGFANYAKGIRWFKD